MKAETLDMEMARQHYRARMAQRYKQREQLRLQLVMHKGLALKAIYADQLGRFVNFVQDLA